MKAASTPAAVRPVYFPQTFLPPETLAALRPVFRSLTVVQPDPACLPEDMQPFADSGFLEVLPCPGGGGNEGALREYQRWGERHRGGVGVAAAWGQERRAANALGADGTPCEIAAAIRGGAASARSSVPADPLRAAELFLRLAQDADRQAYQLGRSLCDCERRHEWLFDALRGETRRAADGAHPPPVGGGHMASRMAAWTRVFLSLSCPLPVFVTHHPDAVEWLCERSPAPLRVPLETLPGMLPELTPTAFGPGAGACLPAVHIWAETPPEVFLARVLRIDTAAASSGSRTGRHTLVVQIPARDP